MATEIRSKDYSFPEAFNAVGKKLVLGWTGDEIEARECHSPEDVEKMSTRGGRHLKFMKENPGLVAEDWPIRIADAKRLFEDRQSGPLRQEIEDLKQDPEAYQERYALWSRRCEAERPFNDILHHDHADGWIETPEGDILEIEPTHWGRRGPFIPPQLPGTCGEYKGEVGEVWIGKERLDGYLKTFHSPPAAGPTRREDKKEEKRREYETWAEAATAFKKEHPNLSNYQVMLKTAGKMGVNESTFRKMLKKHHPGWAQ